MKKPKAPRLVTVAIVTTITIIFWVFFSLYTVFTSKPPATIDPKLLLPLDPNLDTNALRQLEERVFFEEGSYTSPSLIKQNTTKSEKTNKILIQEGTESATQKEVAP